MTESQIYASSLCLAVGSLSILGWKWRISMRTVIPGALLIGGLTGVVAMLINSKLVNLNIVGLIFIELFTIFVVVFILILVRFYRDPERLPLETGKVVLSPADGTIIYVRAIENGSSIVSTKGKRQFELTEILGTELLCEAQFLVGIDMNILNVHVNRSPIGGDVILQKRVEGKFLSLRRPESETTNERLTTFIDNGQFRVAVIQIASRLVRRIVSYVKEGDRVGIGQRIGIIRFGSQVDLVIPRLANLAVMVKPGDQVKAGLSIIARYGWMDGS